MIIDLRDYALTPNTRDKFIERCETLLFPEQKRLGATFLGTFRDADNPNGFVWLRAAANLQERQRILTAFYTDGEIWKANCKEVNSWIVDSDNVLLVKPVSDLMPPSMGSSVVAMYTYLKREPFNMTDKLDEVATAIEVAGGRLLVKLVTDPCENNYPRHPIRTGEFGFVCFATFNPNLYRSLGLSLVKERKLFPTQQSWLR